METLNIMDAFEDCIWPNAIKSHWHTKEISNIAKIVEDSAKTGIWRGVSSKIGLTVYTTIKNGEYNNKK